MESTGSESTAVPTSTADIAANVIESAEAADTGSTSDTGESSSPTRIDTTNAVEEKPAAPAATPTQAELSAAAKFLLKEGHQAKKVDGRDVWLPHGTVEKMLDRYLTQHQSTWTTEKQSFESRVKEAQDQIATLRSAVAGDPKAFLSELAQIDPRYAAFLEQKAAAAAMPVAADDPEPQPDYDLGNGHRTYSVEGLAKREAWVRRQIERELLGKLDERLKPWQEREQQATQREAHDKAIGEIRDRATSQMQEAQTWPLFGKMADDGSLTEFQQSVLDELKRDTEAAKTAGHTPKLTLEGAYIRVASKRFTEDDTTKRERLLKEIQGAPKSSALARQTTDAPRTPGPKSTQEIARQVISKLESAG